MYTKDIIDTVLREVEWYAPEIPHAFILNVINEMPGALTVTQLANRVISAWEGKANK